MNNHWYTNYRADQEGPTTFRYSLAAAQAIRSGGGAAVRHRVQPAAGGRCRPEARRPSGRPLLELDTPDVIVASIKPSDDRKAWIVRLFGAAGRPAKAALRWADTHAEDRVDQQSGRGAGGRRHGSGRCSGLRDRHPSGGIAFPFSFLPLENPNHEYVQSTRLS